MNPSEKTTIHLNSMYPLKKGKLAKNNDDSLLLINDSGTAYATNEEIVITWQLCLGDKSIGEICDEFNEMLSAKKTSLVSQNLIQLIQKLETAKLLVLSDHKVG